MALPIDEVAVTADRANIGQNLRAVWWFDGDRQAVDQEACATWTEHSGPIAQAGVALRVRQVGEATQAITVTNNIMWGARNGWNVHLWSSGMPGRLLGQAVLSHSFGARDAPLPPLPWRVCARVVGRSLQFKAWSVAAHPDEPGWGDPGFGTSFWLPSGWIYPGHAGWYVGHLRGGDEVGYRSLSTGVLELQVLARVAVSTQMVADDVQRGVADLLSGAVGVSWL